MHTALAIFHSRRVTIRVAVTTSPGDEGLQHFQKLAPVVVRAGYLFAVNFGGTAGGP
jgi:hypothetical protein